MTWVRRILVAFACLLVLGIASIPFVAPAMAAYACPTCYGLERVADGVYLEKGTDPAPVLATLAVARERTTAGFSGERVPQARYLICHTEDCDQRLGGKGARARAYGEQFVVVSPRGIDETILSHEMAHLIVHEATGTLGLLRGELLAWRNEGIAVLVSRDERYFDFSAATPACRVEPQADLPTSVFGWGQRMRPDTHISLYSQAACAVFREHGLPPYALETLLQGNG